MKEFNKKAVLNCRSLQLKELEFITRQEVSLMVNANLDGMIVPAQILMNKRVLYHLLKNANKQAEELIGIISQKFREPHEVPVFIDLVQHFGVPIMIEQCELKLERSYYQNDAGEWKLDYNTNLFFAEEIEIPKGAKQLHIF